MYIWFGHGWTSKSMSESRADFTFQNRKYFMNLVKTLNPLNVFLCKHFEQVGHLQKVKIL